VEYLAVAVALRPPAPAAHPRRHRQQVAHRCPLGIGHIGVVAAEALAVVARVPVPVREAVTPWGHRGAPDRGHNVQKPQPGLLAACGFDNLQAAQGALSSCGDYAKITPTGNPGTPVLIPCAAPGLRTASQCPSASEPQAYPQHASCTEVKCPLRHQCCT